MGGLDSEVLSLSLLPLLLLLLLFCTIVASIRLLSLLDAAFLHNSRVLAGTKDAAETMISSLSSFS